MPNLPPIRTKPVGPDGFFVDVWQRFFTAIANQTLAGVVSIVISFSPTPLFPTGGNNPVAFEMTLTGNVTSSSITGIFAGQLVTFIVIQDAVGGWTFAWPSNVKDAGTVDTTPSTRSIQTFVVSTNGNLYPISPMTVNS